MDETIEVALVGAVSGAFEAQFPGIPIAYPNGPFNWDNLPEKFVQYEVSFLGGRQIGMSVAPKTSKRGMVYVTAYQRTGSGVLWSRQVHAWFTGQLEYQIFMPTGARIVLEAADNRGDSKLKGWECQHLAFEWVARPT